MPRWAQNGMNSWNQNEVACIDNTHLHNKAMNRKCPARRVLGVRDNPFVFYSRSTFLFLCCGLLWIKKQNKWTLNKEKQVLFQRKCRDEPKMEWTRETKNEVAFIDYTHLHNKAMNRKCPARRVLGVRDNPFVIYSRSTFLFLCCGPLWIKKQIDGH